VGSAAATAGVRVGARVVGDDDAPRERQLRAQVAVQVADAALERRLLVVDGDDDVDVGHDEQAPGIDPEEIITAVRTRRAPMMSASAGLRL
jgi:hypothetical protein